jgi:hypothetical protein
MCLAAWAPLVCAQSARLSPVNELGQKAIRRLMLGQGSVARAFGFQPFVRPAITDDDWKGGAGNWNSTNWSLNSAPTSSNNAVINNSTPAAVVQLNVSDTINNLTIGSTSVLNFNSGNTLTIDGTTITNSNKTGTGGIFLNAAGNYTQLILANSVTLTGGGTVTLSNNGYNYISGAAGSDVLTTNNTIQGSGQIGFGTMGLVNSGIIDANQPTVLTIQTSSGTTNTGILEATNGGNLVLDGDTYTNATGTIEASGSGSVVTLENTVINGGTLSTPLPSGGLIQASGTPTLNGVTNNGTYQLPSGNDTLLVGTMTNTGAIQLMANGNYTELQVSGAVTLTGGGTVTMSDNFYNYIYSPTAGGSLTNVNNTISGAGNIGNGSMGFTNQALGVVNAKSALGNTLFIDTSTYGTTNLGLMEASSGGTLEFDNTTVANTNGTTNGSIEALNGGTVLLNGATISGGSITATGTGVILAESGSVLDGSTNAVTTSGTLQVPSGNQLFIKGTLNNNGALSLNAAGNYTELVINTPTATLQGTGTITLSDNDYNYILANTTGNQLTIKQPITGPGGNIGDGTLVVTNETTIDATASSSGSVLTIESDGTFTNKGVLEATGGGTLVFDGGTIANTGFTITAAGSTSTVDLEGVDIVGGTLNGSGTYVATSGTQLDGSTHTVTSDVNLQLPSGNDLVIKGTLKNNGTLSLNAAGNYTELQINSATATLEGTGSVTFSDNDYNYILASATGNKLTIEQPITGPGGNIGDGTLVVVNQSTIDATKSASTSALTLQPDGTFTNTGTLEATGGGSLILDGGTFANTGGTISATSGSNVTLADSVTITGGTLSGAGLYTSMDGTTLNGVTSSVTVEIPSGTGTTLEGTITNTGSLQLNANGNYTYLYINGNTTLNGNGTIVLSNSQYNYIQGVAGTEVLTNNGNTIEGAGNIGDGLLGLVNNAGGTILANQPTELFIQPNASGFTNNGTVQVNTGSLMNVEGTGALTNFNSSNDTLTGGTYNINGGELEFVGANIVNNAADIVLTGSGAEILNSSNSANALANFAVNEAAGTFQLGAGHSFTTAGTFTNDGSLIVGAGDTFKVGNGDLTNFASSTLTGGSYFVGGTLQFGASGTHINTNDASLTLSGANPSVINSGGGNLLANLATNDSGARFAVVNGASYTTAGAFANSGTLDLENGGTLTVAGALTNSGTVSTNGTNQAGAANTLTVTGTLTNNTGATVAIGENNDTSDVASIGILTNSAAVTVGKGATLNLTGTGTDTNTGAIAVTNGILSLATAADLDMEKGGSLTVTGNLTNAGTIGTNEANQGGPANTITVSGTLTNKAGATLTIGANNDTSDSATVGSLANSGAVTVGTGASLTIDGTNTNAGTIAVDGSLDFSTASTIAGKGTLTLNNGSLDGVGSGITLDNKSIIEGSGTISNLVLTNGGTIDAGTGDTMKIGTSAGGALTNFSGTTLTGGIYTIGGTLQFGSSGTTIATNDATITLSGTGKMIDFGNNNILAGFNNNAAAGVFKLASSASLTTTGGAFVNNGLFTVSTGTTFTVGGTSFGFTQATGTTTVDGTLTSTTTGTLDITGGDLDGKGTLGYNVVDSGTLSPGDSAAKTGKLTVADTYTQASNGTLDIQIDGTTASKYDKLQVTGSATLDAGSTLDINLKAGVTLTPNKKFTILTASSLTGIFTTINGQVISTNPPLYFAVSYPPGTGTVVLTVTSGTPPTSPASSSLVSTQLIHAPLTHGSIGTSHYGLDVYKPGMVRLPAVAHMPVSLTPLGTGMRAFHPRDDFGSPVAVSAPVDGSAAGSLGLSPVSAAAYNSMGAMNHMRFECGVDLKALLKTSRKQLLKGLWAAPDSPDALSIGYMTFNGAH